MSRRTVYWICQCGGWGGYAVFVGALMSLSMAGKFPWWIYSSAATALLATHVSRRWLRRWCWHERPLYRLAHWIAALSLLLAAISVTPSFGYSMIGGELEWTLRNLEYFGYAVVSWVPPHVVWLLIYLAVKSYERLQQVQVEMLRLEVVAKESQLQALLWQVNPHFLFNCLNSVRALIAVDPPRAQTMVTQLSDLLRYTLRTRTQDTVPLGEELDNVRVYLELEKIRFEERLEFRLQMPDMLAQRRVPVMLVLTLVENAVKHGIAQRREGGSVTVAITEQEGGRLRARVENPGVLEANAGGLGLANARERLTLLYPNSGGQLLLHANGDGIVVAEAQWPAH